VLKKKDLKKNMKTHSKVKQVLCLPTILQHLPSCKNYHHVEAIIFYKLEKRTKKPHIVTSNNL
jgi:hypothetical protein